MKQGFLYRFLVRWFVCSLGLWIAAGLLSSHISIKTPGNDFLAIIVAGLILAIINAIIRPFIVLLSLPAILITLGLFMVVINGLTVWIASRLYSPLHVTNFWGAILAGVVIGLVNYLVTAILENRER
ncbi:MAG TPA: phage holin family protein [Candidatus Saccharimonadales bacterium]|nr:phage holin family protein [Candidatus Saccharimonadales bacterium]